MGVGTMTKILEAWIDDITATSKNKHLIMLIWKYGRNTYLDDAACGTLYKDLDTSDGNLILIFPQNYCFNQIMDVL